MVAGSDKYTSKLLALDACKSLSDHRMNSKVNIITPLPFRAWAQGHPDRAFVDYVVNGIKEGFRIRFNRSCSFKSACSDLPTPQGSLVQDYLSREVSLSRMVTWTSPDMDQLHISPLELIPKRHKPGKWQLIVDLSSPKGRSVNDEISLELALVQYTHVNHLASLTLLAGRGLALVKADIKEVYSNIPDHPDDHHLLAVQWEGVADVDSVLLFGLRSAPLIFSAVAYTVQWMLWEMGVTRSLHYLDDFALVEHLYEQAMDAKEKMRELFHFLGLPLEPSKLKGPSTSPTFLGIQVDTFPMQLRLLADKLERLLGELHRARGRRTVTRRELQSLTGLLQHATTVVRPGGVFLQRLYALYCVGSEPSHNIRLNTTARADIVWWELFISRWNGILMLVNPKQDTADTTVASDASSNWEAGALCLPSWFYFEWTQTLRTSSIQVKELVPVVVAAALFGRYWKGKLVAFSVDNQAVVEIINIFPQQGVTPNAPH